MNNLEEILELNKSDLVSLLKEKELDFDQTQPKHKLQLLVINELVQTSNSTTHFENQQDREKEILSAGKTCIQRAVNQKQSYKVVESFRERDKESPIYIRPSHYKNHKNQTTVLEILIPSNPYVHIK